MSSSVISDVFRSVAKLQRQALHEIRKLEKKNYQLMQVSSFLE
jgi:hypothetical protein